MDHPRPDTSRETVFDDLPESIMAGEIFMRLPVKDVLCCGAVSRSWRGATTNKEFLLEHHSRQPSLPLIVFPHETSSLIRTVDAFDIRRAPAERRPVLGFNDCIHGQTFSICASCDGLLLLSLMNYVRFSIVNPATRQWLALPRLAGASGNIAGMYPSPVRSDEYRILFWRGKHEVRNAGYYVLTVGSSQKPKYLGLPAASACMKEAVMKAGTNPCWWSPPVRLKGCLHWNRSIDWDRSPWNRGSSDRVFVFDILEESFRFMTSPDNVRGFRVLFQMEGMLGMRCLDTNEGVMQIWVLHDYEREAWSLKCQIDLPTTKYWYRTIMSDKSDMLVCYLESFLHQLHYDDNGKLLEKFQWETQYPDITEHWFKESLVRHTFFPKRRGSRVRQARFFRML
jgi:F-box interacting protein